MPYKRHNPVPESLMEQTIMEGENMICQTIREMYHITDDPDIRLKCRIAMSMAKSMCRKMMAYREIYGATEHKYQDGI